MRRIVYRTISYTALILYFIHEKLRKSKKDNSRISKWYVSYNNNFYILCCVIVGGILDHNIYELGFAEIKLKRWKWHKNKKNRGLQIKKMWYNYNHIEI